MYTKLQTTCLVNNKIYVGEHKQKKHFPVLFDGYLGSGTALKSAIKKYGIKNFERVTLFVFDTSGEALKKEREIVTPEFVARKDTYNMVPGGKGPKNYRQGKKFSEEHKKNLSKSHMGHIMSKETISKRTAAKMVNNRINAKYIYHSPFGDFFYDR